MKELEVERLVNWEIDYGSIADFLCFAILLLVPNHRKKHEHSDWMPQIKFKNKINEKMLLLYQSNTFLTF